MTTAYEMMADWAMEQVNGAEARGPLVELESHSLSGCSNGRAQIVSEKKEYTRIGGDCIFIDDLVLDASIGIYADELTARQPVRIALYLELEPLPAGIVENAANIVCYGHVATGIQKIIDEGHIGLVETLAERIAEFCLALPRAACVSVSVSKPEALENAGAAGVKITRRNISNGLHRPDMHVIALQDRE